MTSGAGGVGTCQEIGHKCWRQQNCTNWGLLKEGVKVNIIFFQLPVLKSNIYKDHNFRKKSKKGMLGGASTASAELPQNYNIICTKN